MTTLLTADEAARCSIVGCDSPVKARGWCVKHYHRWLRNGDPLVAKVEQHKTVRRSLRDHPAPTPQSTPCRLWQGAIGSSGYGVKGKRQYAHRWVMSLALGRPLTRSEVVMHLCDNRLCYRFDHLVLGTVADNNADMQGKGRGRGGSFKGEAHRSAVLTAELVTEIRSSSEPSQEVASRLGVTRRTIQQIRSRETWRHIP